jgi:hypothetical protein
MWMQQEQDDRCLYAMQARGNSERLPFCCLSIARLLRAAMADRSFRLVETL